MSNLENKIKDKLYNLETPLGGNVSFEKVMAMRNKERGFLWWKPALLVACTLSVVSLAGYYFYQKYSSATASQPGIVENNKNGSSNSDKVQSHSGNSDLQTQMGEAEHSENPAIQSNTNSGFTPLFGKPSTPRQSIVAEEEDRTAKDPMQETIVEDVFHSDWSGLHCFGLREKWEKYSLNSNHKKLKLKYTIELPRRDKHPPTLELMMATGNRNVKDYATMNQYAVKGIHHFTQFSASALWDLGKGWKAGAGIGYSQFAGNGEWRNLVPVTTQKVRLDTTIIVQPGFPDKQVITSDTTYVTSNEIQTGKLSYTLSKVSVPLSFQYYLGHGSTLLRINGVVAPGWLSAENGQIFSKESSRNTAGSVNQMTLDGRLGLGLYYVLTKHTAIIIEPGATYQSVMGSGWNTYNRVGFGMGFGLMIKL